MDKFYLKHADINHIDMLFRWANDQTARANAFNTAPISYEEYQSWFVEKINSESSIIFVYYYENNPTGQIRIDINDDEGRIVYSIDEQYRLLGHGKIILQLLEVALKKDYPGIKSLRAKVKYNHIASQVKLEQLYYEKILETEDYIEYRKYAEDFKDSLPTETNVRGGGG